jgi:hypothetical protein
MDFDFWIPGSDRVDEWTELKEREKQARRKPHVAYVSSGLANARGRRRTFVRDNPIVGDVTLVSYRLHVSVSFMPEDVKTRRYRGRVEMDLRY